MWTIPACTKAVLFCQALSKRVELIPAFDGQSEIDVACCTRWGQPEGVYKKHVPRRRSYKKILITPRLRNCINGEKYDYSRMIDRISEFGEMPDQ